MSDAVLDNGKWICKLCEAFGTGGYKNYFQHYGDNHNGLEKERRRVI